MASPSAKMKKAGKWPIGGQCGNRHNLKKVNFCTRCHDKLNGVVFNELSEQANERKIESDKIEEDADNDGNGDNDANIDGNDGGFNAFMAATADTQPSPKQSFMDNVALMNDLLRDGRWKLLDENEQRNVWTTLRLDHEAAFGTKFKWQKWIIFPEKRKAQIAFIAALKKKYPPGRQTVIQPPSPQQPHRRNHSSSKPSANKRDRIREREIVRDKELNKNKNMSSDEIPSQEFIKNMINQNVENDFHFRSKMENYIINVFIETVIRSSSSSSSSQKVKNTNYDNQLLKPQQKMVPFTECRDFNRFQQKLKWGKPIETKYHQSLNPNNNLNHSFSYGQYDNNYPVDEEKLIICCRNKRINDLESNAMMCDPYCTFFKYGQEHPLNAVLKLISNCKKNIKICVPYMTKRTEFDGIIEKIKISNIKVYIILDGNCTFLPQMKKHAMEYPNNLFLKIFKKEQYRLQHSKRLIFDDEIVVEESKNMTYAGNNKNVETATILHPPNKNIENIPLTKYIDHWNYLWNNSGNTFKICGELLYADDGKQVKCVYDDTHNMNRHKVAHKNFKKRYKGWIEGTTKQIRFHKKCKTIIKSDDSHWKRHANNCNAII